MTRSKNTFIIVYVQKYLINNNMKNNLQIIKQLQNKFGEFEYKLNDNNEVISLDLSDKGVKTADLKLIEGLTSLEKLDLSRNKITKIQGLDNLTKLEDLNFFNNQITKIEGLDNLTNLKILDLSKNNIPKKELDQFKMPLFIFT